MIKNILIIFFFLLFFTITLGIPNKLYAFCIITGPSPWYTTKLQFDNLPPGVSVEPNNSQDPVDPYVLRNISSTPFYLVRKIDITQNHYDFSLSELPKNINPDYKLVNGQVYEFNTKIGDSISRWHLIERGDDYYSQNEIKRLFSLLAFYGIPNQNVLQDNRPTNIIPPSPQEFSLNTYYGKNPLQINGRIIYELNNDYDPQAGVKGSKACAEGDGDGYFGLNSILLAIITIVIVTIGIILIKFIKFHK